MTDELTPRQALMREAALWLAKLDSGTADRVAFESWRSADPRNAAAIARLIGVNNVLDGARPRIELEDIAVLSAAGQNRRTWMLGFATTAATAVVAIAGGVAWRESRASAVTGIGDRQMISLPGGGQLDLNTDTKVYYRFDKRRHRVWLERGEIALSQPAGPNPCQLVAGSNSVDLPVGKINARRMGDKLALVVQKGDCVVRRPNARTTTLLANQVATVAPGAEDIDLRTAGDAERQFATGWQTDELILDGQSLATAVSEFNRYQSAKIIIGDPTMADVHLGGRFSLHDPNDFLAALQSSFGIRSTKSANGGIVLSR